MSRLSGLSPAALRAMFAPEADCSLMVLLTFSGAGIAPVRLADNYTQRISETADDVVYGTVSRGMTFQFLPFELTLPEDSADGVPRCELVIHDVTSQLLPVLRGLRTALDVKIELVLTSSPDTVEFELVGFVLGGVTYSAQTIRAELTQESLESEPFPADVFAPSTFPGLF